MAIVSLHYRRHLVNLFTIVETDAKFASYEAWRWVWVMGTDYQMAYDTLLETFVVEEVDHGAITSHYASEHDYLADTARTMLWSAT